MNLKGIINNFEKFSTEHLQINDFGYGSTSNVSTKNHNFVLLWIDALGGSVNISSNIYTFDFYVLDLLKQNGENLIDIWNDTEQIGKDIISIFYDQETTYDFTIDETSIDLEYLTYVFDDFLAGVKLSISVETKSPLNICEVPYEFIQPPTPPTPPTPPSPCPLYEKESDYVYATRIAYVGKAPLGNEGPSSSVWCITKIETNYEGAVLSTEQFTNVKWSDRYSL